MIGDKHGATNTTWEKKYHEGESNKRGTSKIGVASLEIQQQHEEDNNKRRRAVKGAATLGGHQQGGNNNKGVLFIYNKSESTLNHPLISFP